MIRVLTGLGLLVRRAERQGGSRAGTALLASTSVLGRDARARSSRIRLYEHGSQR